MKAFALAILSLALPLGAHAERLVHHEIQTDAHGLIVPWYSAEPGRAYDHVIRRVWDFWQHMGNCPNGVPYYLQHQVWKPEHDPRGLGGDQNLDGAVVVAAALRLHGRRRGVGQHGAPRRLLARPRPVRRGRGLAPPAVSLQHRRPLGPLRRGHARRQRRAATGQGGLLRQRTGRALPTHRPAALPPAAVAIADTLARKVQPGDDAHSPWPFRVVAQTGEMPASGAASRDPRTPPLATAYTANWTGALRLLESLLRLQAGRTGDYRQAFEVASAWLKQYPLKTNQWGPFFEDVREYSNTEINADTMARYLLEHPEWDPNWRVLARGLLDGRGRPSGPTTGPGTASRPFRSRPRMRCPANSHSVALWLGELIYAEKTGDTTRRAESIRLLDWATCMGGRRRPRPLPQ